jgi:hypothetical protein
MTSLLSCDRLPEYTDITVGISIVMSVYYIFKWTYVWEMPKVLAIILGETEGKTRL